MHAISLSDLLQKFLNVRLYINWLNILITLICYVSRTSQHPNEFEALNETHKEIERETDRIRREMEKERRSRSQPAVRERSPTRTYLSLTSMPKVCILTQP